MDKIKELVLIVENSSLYNDELRIKIENNLKRIKSHKSIDLDVIIN